MDKRQLELYTDYLISNYGYATATGLSAMVNGAVVTVHPAAHLPLSEARER